MAKRGRPLIGEAKLSAKERKQRFDGRMRNANGEVPGQPSRTPVVVYLSEAARSALRNQRLLASEAELPALVDSVVIEAALEERLGAALTLDADRVRRLKEHIQWLEAQLGHYQSLYLHVGRGNGPGDLKVRKQWFQQVVRGRIDASPGRVASSRDLAVKCRAAIQGLSGYEARKLVVDLVAIERNKLEFEDHEKALADRLCDYMDRALGV
ncbi:MAG: hypothetical protein E6R08_00325 [Nevskiaceae bacterium]|nr:MAG: hypothetical protein E6R08_00325 [Nevskiaceae bacterium]